MSGPFATLAQTPETSASTAATRKLIPLRSSSLMGTCPPVAPFLAKSPSPPSNLKRSRSPTATSTTMDFELPPAPSIDGEAMLEIFVHSSIRFTGMPLNSDSLYGDGDRLATLGNKMLEAAYVNVLFNRRPMLTREEIEAALNNLNDFVEIWVEGYKWREKVRHAPDVDLRTPKETRYLMNAYVGAVSVRDGFAAVMQWITTLVDPTARSSEPEYKRARTVESQASYPFQPAYQPMHGYGMAPPMPPMAPPPPAVPPPPLPAQNPLSPAQPQSAFLPLFNQTAQQRRLEVQYPATFSGPAHAGRWMVSCLVNGQKRGEGTGTSKQLAKEEAARQAYHAMGWAPRV